MQNDTVNGSFNCYFKVEATFTFKTLFHQAEQHLATEVTEVWRLVRVDMKDVWTNLQLFHRSARYWQHTETHIERICSVLRVRFYNKYILYHHTCINMFNLVLTSMLIYQSITRQHINAQIS